jgi:hypothetical protein
MANFDNEEVNFMEVIINLLRENVDKELKLKILRKMSSDFENQLSKVNRMILDLEGAS